MFRKVWFYAVLVLGFAVGIGGFAVHRANSEDPARSNIFDPVEIQQKERFLGLDVVKVDLRPFGENRWVGEVTFGGEVAVSGTYKPDPFSGETQPTTPCFFADERTEKKLPRLKGDERFMWFCFNNPQAVLEALGTAEKRVEIVIDDYKVIYIPSDVTNRATFVRPVSRKP